MVVENPPGNTIGYDNSDQMAVENETYGGPDKFKAFVDACHSAGSAVILDIVHNHWGPWDLITNQFDGWYTTEYPGGIYFYDSADWNSPFGPRPNYSSANVAQYIYDSLNMWIGEYRIDGFRWDSVSNIYNTNSGAGTYLPDGWTLLQNANVQTVTQNPAFLNIAEDLTGNRDCHRGVIVRRRRICQSMEWQPRIPDASAIDADQRFERERRRKFDWPGIKRGLHPKPELHRVA